MTDTSVPDATVFPQDDGTGVSNGNESFTSAAGFQLLSNYKGGGSYVGEDKTGAPTLQFNDVDTSNEQVDVGSGFAYISEAGHTIQSGAQTIYDTILPVETPYVVILPNEITNLDLGTDTSNDIWLALDPSNNDDVFIRHGSGLSAPSVPSVKLGTVDTSTGDTTRPNDLAEIRSKSLSTDEIQLGETETLDGTIDVSGVSSHTYQISGTYDDVVIKILALSGTATGTTTLSLTVAGETDPNYNHRRYDGTVSSGNTDWLVTKLNQVAEDRIGHITLKQSYANRPQMLNTLSSATQEAARTGQYVGDPGTPISQFTLSLSSGNFDALKAVVIGRSF